MVREAADAADAADRAGVTGTGTAPGSEERPLLRRLGLLDATAIVAGSMIGSGIFIVSADIARQLKTPLALLLVWLFTALVTVAGAWSYGRLAMTFPRAGGQYVYLREAWGDLGGFLYGWAALLVIQTGTIAAVAVAFAKYLGVLWPSISGKTVFFRVGFLRLTPLELVAVALVALLTWWNTTSVENGARLQNVFTGAKVLSLAGLLLACLLGGSRLSGLSFALPAASELAHPALWAFAVATVGALFAADAWNNVTFLGEEVRDAERNVPRALVLGTGLVTGLYLLVNLGYLNVLSLTQIGSAPEDRVATAAIGMVGAGGTMGAAGTRLLAGVILVATFGCLNGLILSGARVLYAMSRDRLFFSLFARVSPETRIPVAALVAQAVWASVLCLSGKYNDLLDYVITTVLIFYVATIAGRWKLARSHPALRASGPADRLVPILYVAATAYVTVALALYKPAYTLPGIAIVAAGVPAFFLLRRQT